MKSCWIRLVRQEEGQDLLEYALIVALIVVVVVGSISLAGGWGQLVSRITGWF